MLIEINLLPLEFRGKAKTDKKRLSLQIPRFVLYLIGGVIMLLVVLSFSIITYSSALKGSLARAKRMLKQEQTRAAQAITIQADIPNLEERSALLAERVGSKILWWEILDQIGRSCPNEATLKSLKVEYDNILMSPSTLVISGTYENGSGVELTYTRNLQSSTKLAKYIESIYPGQTTVMENKTLFTVKCQFKMPQRPARKEQTKDKKTTSRKSAEERG